jgi:hypothetical protein
VPAHRIVMSTPPLELGGADVVFEVYIDDAKRGELHVSRGDLTWRPKHSKKSEIKASWAQFVEWMEPE